MLLIHVERDKNLFMLFIQKIQSQLPSQISSQLSALKDLKPKSF